MNIKVKFKYLAVSLKSNLLRDIRGIIMDEAFSQTKIFNYNCI